MLRGRRHGATGDDNGSRQPGTSNLPDERGGDGNGGRSPPRAVPNPPKHRRYTYTPISDIVHVKPLPTSCNVFGIVKYMHATSETTTGEQCFKFGLTGPGLAPQEKLKCVFFGSDARPLPDICDIGDIIRIHRLKLLEYNLEPQGQRLPSSACVVFDGHSPDKVPADLQDNFMARTTDQTFTLTSDEKAEVTRLRNWSAQNWTEHFHEEWEAKHGIPGKTPRLRFTRIMDDSTMSKLHFDIVCQVIATANVTCSNDSVCLLTTVWDGTRLESHEVLRITEDTSTVKEIRRLEADQGLLKLASGRCYDVRIFDEHYRNACQLKPGDYVVFYNLRRRILAAESGALAKVELTMNGGGEKFNRHLEVLAPDSQEAVELKQFIGTHMSAEDTRGANASHSTSISVNKGIESGQGNSTTIDRRLVIETGASTSNGSGDRDAAFENDDDDRDSLFVTPSSQPEFMVDRERLGAPSHQEPVKTATIVNPPHHDMPLCNIFDVRQYMGSEPRAFRLLAKCDDLAPLTDNPEEFIWLRCRSCEYRNTLAAVKLAYRPIVMERDQHNSLFPHYLCPVCHKRVKKSENDDTSDIKAVFLSGAPPREMHGVPVLQVLYVISMRLKPALGEGSLLVAMAGGLVNHFLGNLWLSPAELLASPERHRQIQRRLKALIVTESGESPYLELCVKASYEDGDHCCRVYDTQLSQV